MSGVVLGLWPFLVQQWQVYGQKIRLPRFVRHMGLVGDYFSIATYELMANPILLYTCLYLFQILHLIKIQTKKNMNLCFYIS